MKNYSEQYSYLVRLIKWLSNDCNLFLAIMFWWIIDFTPYVSVSNAKVHIWPSQTSVIERLCENSERFLVVNYFAKTLHHRFLPGFISTTLFAGMIVNCNIEFHSLVFCLNDSFNGLQNHCCSTKSEEDVTSY